MQSPRASLWVVRAARGQHQAGAGVAGAAVAVGGRRYFARRRQRRLRGGQHGGQRDGVTVTVAVFFSRFPRLREPEAVFVGVWRVAKIASQ